MEIKKFKSDIKDKVTSVTETISDLKEGGRDKFFNYVNNLSDIIPIIATTGYRLKGVDIEISLPPGISMQFSKVENISKEKINEIMEANKDNELLKSIIKSLVMADELHNKIKMGNLQLTTINVNLTLPPKVSIKFA